MVRSHILTNGWSMAIKLLVSLISECRWMCMWRKNVDRAHIVPNFPVDSHIFKCSNYTDVLQFWSRRYARLVMHARLVILFYIQLFLLTDVKLLTLSSGLKTLMGTKVPQVMTFQLVLPPQNSWGIFVKMVISQEKAGEFFSIE